MSSKRPSLNPTRKLPTGDAARCLTSHSFPHGVIRDLVSPELLRNVRSEILQIFSFTAMETDNYMMYQSGDLENLDGLELLPSTLILRDILYSSVFRDYISTVTGSGPLSARKTDLTIDGYTPGCHFLCHDDVIGSRRISFTLYLTDPDQPWKEEWGGALRLYPTVTHIGDDGSIVKAPTSDHEVVIPPAFNQFSFFAVQPGGNFHDVEEVYASLGTDDKAKDEIPVRMAITGWYHIPQEGEEGFVDGLEEKLAEKSSLMQLQSKVDSFDLPKMDIHLPKINCNSSFGTDYSAKTPNLREEQDLFLSEDDTNFLIKYISPRYLALDTLNSVSDEGDGSSLTIDGFLTPSFSESLREFISIQESQPLPTETTDLERTTPWTVARPPHKHRFLFQQIRETHKQDSRSQSPLQDLLENLLPSLPFYKWLQLATGQKISSHNLLARRFRRGLDYTLATGYEEDEPRIEIILAITPSTGWEPDGGDEDADGNKGEARDDHTQEWTGRDADGKPRENTEEETRAGTEKKVDECHQEETKDIEEEKDQSPEMKTDESAQVKNGESAELKTGDSSELKIGDSAELTTDESAEEKTGESTKEQTSGSAEESIHQVVEVKPGERAEEQINKVLAVETGESEGERVEEGILEKTKDRAGEKTADQLSDTARRVRTGEGVEDRIDDTLAAKTGESTGENVEEDIQGKAKNHAGEKTADENPDTAGRIKTGEAAEERIDDTVETKPCGGVETKPGEDATEELNPTPEHNADKDAKAKTRVRSASNDVGGYAVCTDGGEEELVRTRAGWNKLEILLREKGTARFVKYVSRQANGDRWDVCGEYGVVSPDEQDGGQVDGAGMDYYTTEEEKETESSDEY